MKHHVVNGDQLNGWYCYQCDFFTRDVEKAAEHDGMVLCETAASLSGTESREPGAKEPK